MGPPRPQRAIIRGSTTDTRKTLAAVFANPVNGNIEWRHTEALLLALGAVKDEGQGSAVTFFLNAQEVSARTGAPPQAPYSGNLTLRIPPRAPCRRRPGR